MMVRLALWDKCTAAGLHPSHDALRSLLPAAGSGEKLGINVDSITWFISGTDFYGPHVGALKRDTKGALFLFTILE